MSHSITAIEQIANRIFKLLADTFPVACASDEFYYFPQMRLPEPDWSRWDHFTPATVAEVVSKLSIWETELNQWQSPRLDWEARIDLALLKKLSVTLREQLAEVRTWQTQPTFYLTLAGLGLAEAMAAEDPAARHQRAKNLASFLDQARHNLSQVPALFRDLGLEMVPETKNYLLVLQPQVPELQTALAALDRFNDALTKMPVRHDFTLPGELLQRIVRFHLNCELELPELNSILDQEIQDMQMLMVQEARTLIANAVADEDFYSLWSKALTRIPLPPVRTEGLIRLYQDEVGRLAEHCVNQGLVSPELVSACPVEVAPVPSYLATIRTASSYSIPPKYPPAGGSFYVNQGEMIGKDNGDRLREYRMLSAHETYPGHHLLDSLRWRQGCSIRRVIEQPVFYEGWACFAEELMRLTGYFAKPGDRFLLAKRRLWRAIRGKVDLGLQTGTMNFSTAAEYLKQTGVSSDWAMASVRKYPLNPGYQLCYAIGIRRFLDLYDRYGCGNLAKFVRTILEQGEINLIDLEKILDLKDVVEKSNFK